MGDLHPYVDRIGQVVFLTESQFQARRVHTDIREIRDHELARLERDEMVIGISSRNPFRKNLLKDDPLTITVATHDLKVWAMLADAGGKMTTRKLRTTVKQAAILLCATEDTIRERCRSLNLECYKVRSSKGRFKVWTVMVPEKEIVPSSLVLMGEFFQEPDPPIINVPFLLMERIEDLAIESENIGALPSYHDSANEQAAMNRIKGEIATLVRALLP